MEKNEIFQYDVNVHVATPEGVRFVDFDTEPPVRVEVIDGKARIPDEILTTPGQKLMWFCNADGTLQAAAVFVTARIAPPDYVSEPAETVTFAHIVEKVDGLADTIANHESRIEELEAGGGGGTGGVSKSYVDMKDAALSNLIAGVRSDTDANAEKIAELETRKEPDVDKSYVDAEIQKVNEAITGNTSAIAGNTERIEALEATENAHATKEYVDEKTAALQDDIESVEEMAADHETRIGALESRPAPDVTKSYVDVQNNAQNALISGNSTAIAAHATRIAALEAKPDPVAPDVDKAYVDEKNSAQDIIIGGHTTTIGSHTTSIANHESRIKELEENGGGGGGIIEDGTGLSTAIDTIGTVLQLESVEGGQTVTVKEVVPQNKQAQFGYYYGANFNSNDGYMTKFYAVDHDTTYFVNTYLGMDTAGIIRWFDASNTLIRYVKETELKLYENYEVVSPSNAVYASVTGRVRADYDPGSMMDLYKANVLHLGATDSIRLRAIENRLAAIEAQLGNT